MPVKPIPEAYHSVTPFLVVERAGKLIEFLKQGLDAKEHYRMTMPDGTTIMHAELKIGDSPVMLSDPIMPQQKAMPSCLYLYVADVDATYKRAVQAGGVSLQEPADQFYGDRSAGIRDPSGNVWFIATHKEDVAPDELERRAKAMMTQRGAGSR